MNWLLKTEPNTYSIQDLKKDRVTLWTGVRNYQARNFLKDMQPGEKVLIYHSNSEPPAVVGLGQVFSKSQVDPTQFEKKSDYFDPKATKEKPIWFCPEIKFSASFSRQISLHELKTITELADMHLLRKGNRLSVMPVKDAEFNVICKLGLET